MGEAFGVLMRHIGATGARVVGPPFTQYEEPVERQFAFAVCSGGARCGRGRPGRARGTAARRSRFIPVHGSLRRHGGVLAQLPCLGDGERSAAGRPAARGLPQRSRFGRRGRSSDRAGGAPGLKSLPGGPISPGARMATQDRPKRLRKSFRSAPQMPIRCSRWSASRHPPDSPRLVTRRPRSTSTGSSGSSGRRPRRIRALLPAVPRARPPLRVAAAARRAAAVAATREALVGVFRRAILGEGAGDLEVLTYAACSPCAKSTRRGGSRGRAGRGGGRRSGASAAQARDDRGMRRRFEGALECLEPRQRAALLLHDLAGLDAARAAVVLGVGEEAAAALLFKAREEFRAALRERGGTGPRRVSSGRRGPGGGRRPGHERGRALAAGASRRLLPAVPQDDEGLGGGGAGLAVVLAEPPLPQALAAAPVFDDVRARPAAAPRIAALSPPPDARCAAGRRPGRSRSPASPSPAASSRTASVCSRWS